MSSPVAPPSKDFFISYTRADRDWAEWIAWQLEAAGYSVVFQKWDFLPGFNFILRMDKATKDAKRTLMVLSPDALNSPFVQAEWAAAFRQDPTGDKGTLLPVRIRECTPTGLLAQIVYADLVGLDEEVALQTLLAAAKAQRPGPGTFSHPPAFPGHTPIPARPQPFFPPDVQPFGKRRIRRRSAIAALVGVGTLIVSGGAWAISALSGSAHKLHPGITTTTTPHGTSTFSSTTDTLTPGTDMPSTTTPASTVIPGTVLFQADLSGSDPQKLYDQWDGNLLSGGTGWQITNGMLVSSGNLSDEIIWIKNPLPTANYAIEAQIQVPVLPDGTSYSGPYVGVFVRVQPPLGGYMIKISGLFALDTAFISTYYSPILGKDSLNSQLARYPLDTRWHTYRVQIMSNAITFAIDGKPVFHYTDSNRLFMDPGQAGLGTGLQKANVRSFSITAL